MANILFTTKTLAELVFGPTELGCRIQCKQPLSTVRNWPEIELTGEQK